MIKTAGNIAILAAIAFPAVMLLAACRGEAPEEQEPPPLYDPDQSMRFVSEGGLKNPCRCDCGSMDCTCKPTREGPCGCIEKGTGEKCSCTCEGVGERGSKGGGPAGKPGASAGKGGEVMIFKPVTQTPEKDPPVP